MKNVIKCLSMTALVFTLFACKKDAEPTKTDFLTAHAWKVTAGEATINGTKQDIFAQAPACEKDNFETFKVDKTAVSDEGPTKCDPTDPQTQQGKWAFLKNETQLEFTLVDSGVSVSITYDIVELTAGKMVLKYTVGASFGTTTYSKK